MDLIRAAFGAGIAPALFLGSNVSDERVTLGFLLRSLEPDRGESGGIFFLKRKISKKSLPGRCVSLSFKRNIHCSIKKVSFDG